MKINALSDVKTALQYAHQQFPPILTAQLDAEVLLAHVLQKKRDYLYARPEYCLTPEQQIQYAGFIQRYITGEPLAYIIGEREFWSLTFLVTPATLIPRVETELLVELTLQCMPTEQAIQLLDLGTGSGAIAIALASERPHWQITAVDKSTAALAVAQENAKKHGVHIKFLHSDWFSSLRDQRFHCIVANPPYVEKTAMTTALSHEPCSALFADNEGLADLEKIIQTALLYLLPAGVLLLEHGCQQSKAVAQFMQKQGYQRIATHQDLASLDRVTLGTK
jgi:release factor glutamine methyltransferase